MSFIKKRATAPFNGRVDIEKLRKASAPSNAVYEKRIAYSASNNPQPDVNLDERVHGDLVGESAWFKKTVAENTPTPVVLTPLKFTSTGASTISFSQTGTYSGTWSIETSTDGSTWSSYTLGTSISLADGESVYFRGEKDSTAQSYGNHRSFVMAGSVVASGDITSLLNNDGGVLDLSDYGTYTFDYLFKDCSVLTSAPSLISEILIDGCYADMFYNCTALVTSPSLPATTLADYCYSEMFWGCTSLASAPSLPAETLADDCYENMFYGCTSLTSAPALPATALAEYCYSSMFEDCTALASAPSLPATTLADGCYDGMFRGTAIITAPDLPAETLTDDCYKRMFRGCATLTGPVTISATSPYSSGTTTTACEYMFTDSGTASGAGGVIKVGGNVSDWDSTNCGIDSAHWTVELK